MAQKMVAGNSWTERTKATIEGFVIERYEDVLVIRLQMLTASSTEISIFYSLSQENQNTDTVRSIHNSKDSHARRT